MKSLFFKLSAFLIMILAAMLFVSSGEQINLSGAGTYEGQRNSTSVLQRKLKDINDNISQKVFDLPKIYTLPLDQSPAPPPDPNGFSEDSYQDPTISVKCWHESMYISGKAVRANFAEVTIAHPTQLRSAFAGGQFGTKRMLASKIASINNAIVAINADFYNYNSNGLIIRNGTVYREKPYGADVLVIDSDGNFTVKSDHEVINEDNYKNKKIYQTFSFGPSIVENGESVTRRLKNNVCGPSDDEPRTAIGQIGPLHYLLCTVDGRMKLYPGVTTRELGKIMIEKKCTVAYNLDGGQSSVLYFRDKPFNVVADGGERTLSDIIYFASAIPTSERS